MNTVSKKLEEVEKRLNAVKITTEFPSKETEMTMIPLAMYELSENRHERKENKLLKIIAIICISSVSAILLIVGGFLLYLNQYDFSYSFYQEQSDTKGDATIEDGIHYNDKIIDYVKG